MVQGHQDVWLHLVRGLMRREEAGKDVCVCVCVCVDAYMSDTLKEQSCDGCIGDIKHGSHPCIPCLNSRRLHRMNHDQLWLEKGGQALSGYGAVIECDWRHSLESLQTLP